MPFIKISTLRNVPEREQLMKNVEQGLYDIEVDNRKLIPEGMATCMWQSMDLIVHNSEVHREFNKTDVETPIFVDLYMNTVFNQDGITLVMQTIAHQLCSVGDISHDNVVIMVHLGQPGYIFISGKVDDCRITTAPEE